MGYYLSESSSSWLIVDGAGRVGDSWLCRWDSLTLFTPRWFSALPGLRFPSGAHPYPDKDEMAAYLQRYATHFELPVQLNSRIDSLTADADGFIARTASGELHAQQVVVATGPFHGPRVPTCAARLNSGIRQLHSYEYTNPGDIPTEDVLVVGGGNSGAQLAFELADRHRVTLASSGPLWFLPKKILGVSLYWWLYATGVLTADRDGRVARYVRQRGDAIIGRELRKKIKTGQIHVHPYRLTDADGDRLTFADGTHMAPSAILWCTGFKPDYRWIHIPGALDDEDVPIHTAGVSPIPCLYWLGLPWQTRLNSSLVNGIGHDAKAVAQQIRTNSS